jgi:hypothetical protein
MKPGKVHRYHPARRNLVNDTPAEHITARVDPASHWVRGLLQERGHAPGRIEGHTAKPRRVRHLDQVECHRGIRLAVQVHLSPDVVAGQDIPVEDDDRVVRAAAQPLSRVADRPTGAEWLLLVHVGDLQAEFGPVTEPFREHLRAVGRGQDDVRDAGGGRFRELMGEEGDPRGRQQVLGRGQGEWAKAGSVPPDEEDRFERFVAGVLSWHKDGGYYSACCWAARW